MQATACQGDGGTAECVPFLDVASMHAEVEGELHSAWRRVLRSRQFVRGPEVERFEHEWAAYCDRRYGVGVGSGTDAIELTLVAMGIGRGDEVIVPTNTFVATVEAVVRAGATPRLVDVDPGTLLVSADTIATAITPRSAAIIVVHLYGQTPNMDAVLAVAERAHLALIEDAAQAHGAAWNGKRAGSFGAAGCFSFYPGKNLGAFGEAGAVVTDDARLAETVRSLTDHGRERNRKHRHSLVGTNSRLDGLQAAVLSVKLSRLDEWNRRRRQAMSWYRALLEASPAECVSVDRRADSSCHLNVIRVPKRDAVRSLLVHRGIETGIHYPVPCHLQPAYLGLGSSPLPVAEKAAQEILSLPLSPHITPQQIERVCEVLDEALRASGDRDGG